MLWFQKYLLGHRALEKHGRVKQYLVTLFCDNAYLSGWGFDCANHDILLSKLGLFGITGRENVLHKPYLSDGYQKVLMYHKNHRFITLSNWAKIKHGVTQDSILGPLLFLLYINDLPEIRNNSSIPILFAGNISVWCTNSNFTNYSKDIHMVFNFINKWFKGNFLSLNFEKTHYIHCITKNNPIINMKIHYDSKLIPSILYTKFLGKNIDSTLFWRNHIEQLISKLFSRNLGTLTSGTLRACKGTAFISKLRMACYIIRSIKPYMSHTSLITFYYSLFILSWIII